MRSRSLTDEIVRRAAAYVDRRGGAAMRRGGRGKGSAGKAVDKLMYALTGFGSGSYYATPVGGGEAGIATGFGAILAVRVDALGLVTRHLWNRATASASAGWLPYIDSSNRIYFACASGAGVAAISPPYQLTQSDVGRVLTLIGWMDGAKVRLAVNRAQCGDGTAITGYTPYSGPTSISAYSPFVNGHATSVAEIGGLTFRGVPTMAQIEAVFDAVRQTGDMPESMQGVTVTHRWSAKSELQGKLLPLVAPATLTDSKSAASADQMVKVGSPTVVTIDAAKPRNWCYEVAPILVGARALSDADYYEAPGGFAGDAASFWFSLLLRPDQQTGLTAGTRALCGQITAASGYYLRTTGMNSLLGVEMANGAGALINGPTGAITAADIGKMNVFTVQYDATLGRIRAFSKRAELGTGQSIVGFTPAAPGSVFRLGRHSIASGLGASGISVLGFAYGTGVLSLADYAAQFDAAVAQERMVTVPGRDATVVNFAPDGTAPGLVRIGNPTLAPVYARAWAA